VFFSRQFILKKLLRIKVLKNKPYPITQLEETAIWFN